MVAPTNEIPLNAVGAIQYSALLHGTLALQVCDRPFANKRHGQTKRRRTEEIQNAVGAGALDSPLYINVFLGSSKAPTPTEV